MPDPSDFQCWHDYFGPGTDTRYLRNKLGLSDRDELDAAERAGPPEG